MFCIYCGNELKPNDKFCNKCGKEVRKFEPVIDINESQLGEIKELLKVQGRTGKDQYACIMGKISDTGRFVVDYCDTFPENSSSLTLTQYQELFQEFTVKMLGVFKGRYNFFSVVGTRTTEIGTTLSEEDKDMVKKYAIDFYRRNKAIYLDGIITEDTLSFIHYDISTDIVHDIEYKLNGNTIEGVEEPGKGAK